MRRIVLTLFAPLLIAGSSRAADPWLVIEGGEGPGKGKNVVLIAGDDEYRSEELIPQLAKILAKRQGFRCTVLFAIDPKDGTINPAVKDNIPGLKALDSADLLVMFLRFRELPDAEMKRIIDYVDSGRPVVALRTSTHAFSYEHHKDSPYAKFDWRSKAPTGGFGRAFFGDTWVSHYGKHQVQSTRGVPAEGAATHPILRGVTEIWGPSDVYEVRLDKSANTPIVMGQVLEGMKPTDAPVTTRPLMPIAWTRLNATPSGKSARAFVTTMGHSGDFQDEGVRRMLVNACYWAVGLEDQIPAKSNVDLVGAYHPTPIGNGAHKPGIRPADLVRD